MKSPLLFWPHFLKVVIFFQSDLTGRVLDILILIHVKLRRYPLFKTKFCQFGLWAEKQLSSASEEQEEESGASPSLAQPLGLAQRLLRWSKVPEHASETPAFTAWLAGQHPHTQLNQMLHNLAHQIIGEHTHIAPHYWNTEIHPQIETEKIDFSISVCFESCFLFVCLDFFGLEKSFLLSIPLIIFKIYGINWEKLFDAIKRQIIPTGQLTVTGRRQLLWSTWHHALERCRIMDLF